MRGMALGVLVAFLLYRFVSSYLVFKHTKKITRLFTQFLDLDLYYTIFIAHHLGRTEVCNLQRWLQKLEAIFESSPQSILQIGK